MEIQQSQKLNQQLVLTQSMRQSLHMLQMPLLELREYLTQAAAENPLLEVECPEGEVALEPEREEPFEPDNPHNPEDFFCGRETWLSGEKVNRRSDENEAMDAGQLADRSTGEESLQDALEEQLLGLNLPKDLRELCRYLISCLDRNGYLQIATKEIAQETGTTVFNVEQALYFLQTLQPAGVGARSLQECLILQLAQGSGFNADTLALVQKGLPLLAKQDISGLEKLLGISRERVKKAAATVAALSPLPGRGYATGGPTQYILPDASIRRTEQGLTAELNRELEPHAHLDEENYRLLKSVHDPESTAYLRTHLTQAQNLLQGMENRRSTLQRVLNCVLEIQQGYFCGMTSLAPMTMEDLARRLDVNVSTISRAVQGKYISFGGGAIQLRSLFSIGVKSTSGEMLTPAGIKLQLKALIGAENLKTPLSDETLTKLLTQSGVEISRRTVAKYRQEMNIPSSAQRKRKAALNEVKG